MISTKDSKEKEIGEKLYFQNSRQMAETLKDVATKDVEKFTYVDIHMPVPLLQVHTFKNTFDLLLNIDLSTYL